MAASKNFLNSLKTMTTQWYNIVVFIVLVGSGIGNYMVSNYKHDQQDIKNISIDNRLKKLEEVNYELLLEQLKEIKAANTELKSKFDKTNERIDNVLEILLSK